MSEIPEQFIREARELLAAEYEKTGWKNDARACRTGEWDRYPAMSTLVRVLFERQQPTFEQRVEVMRKVFGWNLDSSEAYQRAYDRHLAEIMRPKVDPLVEALDEIHGRQLAEGEAWPQSVAERLRKALAARGLEIVAKGDVA